MIGRLKALVAGFALGVFLAPRSGAESRRLLRETIEELLDLRESRFDAMEEAVEARRPGPAAEWPEEPPTGATPPPAGRPPEGEPVREEPPADAPLEDEPTG